jgi:hypothetical protein
MRNKMGNKDKKKEKREKQEKGKSRTQNLFSRWKMTVMTNRHDALRGRGRSLSGSATAT